MLSSDRMRSTSQRKFDVMALYVKWDQNAISVPNGTQLTMMAIGRFRKVKDVKGLYRDR
jgi:hypothetical protein